MLALALHELGRSKSGCFLAPLNSRSCIHELAYYPNIVLLGNVDILVLREYLKAPSDTPIALILLMSLIYFGCHSKGRCSIYPCLKCIHRG
jgi:hypothetical protein